MFSLYFHALMHRCYTYDHALFHTVLTVTINHDLVSLEFLIKMKGPITLKPPYNFSELYQSGIVLAE